jgi:type I restriction enzyme M protein
MTTASQTIVTRLWNYCTLLRDDGLSYTDYLGQLTFLLFLKMAHERTLPPYSQPSHIPADCDWPSLLAVQGDDLEIHYRHVLERLATEDGLLGFIFRRAQNKITTPSLLRRLIVDLIDGVEWTSLGTDVKGDAYEGLLEKNAEDTKSGAGQYFTPRALIHAIVDVMRPTPAQRVCDPACGTGGFLLAAHDYIAGHYALDPDQKRFLRFDALRGWELVPETARLCGMNLFLHGIGGEDVVPIRVADSLQADPGERFEMVLANPPFGKKSGLTFATADDDDEKDDTVIVRDDFWVTTRNKQLNFVQHIKTLLAINGRAAVVVPDNVLFEGGAGETVRRNLLRECDVHTLLRLPTSIFYRQGVKANVLFFDRKPANPNPWTEQVWVYDLRTNNRFTLKTNPMRREHLDDFVASYRAENRHLRQESERFRVFGYDELLKRDKLSMDIFWLRDESLEDADSLPAPDVLARGIVEDLQAALEQFAAIADDLGTDVQGNEP